MQLPLFALIAGVLAVYDPSHRAPGGYPAHWRVDDAPGKGPAWFGSVDAIRDWVDAQAQGSKRKRGKK